MKMKPFFKMFNPQLLHAFPEEKKKHNSVPTFAGNERKFIF